VQIRPAEGKYTGETERGGGVTFGTKPPIPFINCGTAVVRKNIRFNENLNHYVTINKTDGSMQIGVR
jgi:hypothetical protein